MPYPGVPKEKTKKVESCVNKVMNDKRMIKKYKDAKERKSRAIAICIATINK